MIEAGQTLLGPGWTAVEHFDDLDDDEYEDEEEEYVVLDLGTSMDARTLQTEATYQLVGLDTPQPFLKIGDHIFVGAVTPLIGDEVVFDVIRQEDDPQRPQHRPILTTHSRVSMREVTLIPKLAPVGESLPELNHGMFPQRLSSGQAEEKETPARTPRTPRNKAEKPETPAPRRSTRGAATPAAAAAAATPAAAGESTPTASGAGTPATDGRKGRPRGRYTRVSMPISTMEDLMNIQLAGGLGDVRLEIAPDATPELLAQISAIRARPTRPGDKLTKPQEDRLIRGLPATGPGSRGGRGSRGRRGTRAARDTLFAEADGDEEGGSAGEGERAGGEGEASGAAGSATPAEWPASSAAAPSSERAETAEPAEARGEGANKGKGKEKADTVDQDGDVEMASTAAESEDELREINDEDMQALRKR